MASHRLRGGPLVGRTAGDCRCCALLSARDLHGSGRCEPGKREWPGSRRPRRCHHSCRCARRAPASSSSTTATAVTAPPAAPPSPRSGRISGAAGRGSPSSWQAAVMRWMLAAALVSSRFLQESTRHEHRGRRVLGRVSCETFLSTRRRPVLSSRLPALVLSTLYPDCTAHPYYPGMIQPTPPQIWR